MLNYKEKKISFSIASHKLHTFNLISNNLCVCICSSVYMLQNIIESNLIASGMYC